MFWDQSVKLMMTEQWQHLRRNLTDETFINSWWGKRHATFLSSCSDGVKKKTPKTWHFSYGSGQVVALVKQKSWFNPRSLWHAKASLSQILTPRVFLCFWVNWRWNPVGSALPLLCDYECEGESRNRKTFPNQPYSSLNLPNPGLVCWFGSSVLPLPLNAVLQPASPHRPPVFPTFTD